MTNLVEFPGLGISFELPRVAFTIFGIPIYWYGVCIGVGMMLALLFAFSQSRRFGLDSDRMIDVIMIGFVTAILGGRIYYVIFSDLTYDTLFKFIDLRSGGIAIYGAIIGGFLGAWLACKWRKVPLGPMFDLTGMGFLIGQACGRWGNFFNQEAFGSNTKLPWGMISPSTTAYLTAEQAKLLTEGTVVDPLLPVHPTFLYESLWCILGFLLLFFYRKRRKFNGEIFLFYVMWYGLGRFFIEGLRTDSLMISGLGMRVSQLLAAVSVLVAFCIWVFIKVRFAGKPLVVPTLPPKKETVKVETEDGMHEVEITWPAQQDEPHMEVKREMALAILAEEAKNQEENSSKKAEQEAEAAEQDEDIQQNEEE